MKLSKAIVKYAKFTLLFYATVGLVIAVLTIYKFGWFKGMIINVANPLTPP